MGTTVGSSLTICANQTQQVQICYVQSISVKNIIKNSSKVPNCKLYTCTCTRVQFTHKNQQELKTIVHKIFQSFQSKVLKLLCRVLWNAHSGRKVEYVIIYAVIRRKTTLLSLASPFIYSCTVLFNRKYFSLEGLPVGLLKSRHIGSLWKVIFYQSQKQNKTLKNISWLHIFTVADKVPWEIHWNRLIYIFVKLKRFEGTVEDCCLNWGESPELRTVIKLVVQSKHKNQRCFILNIDYQACGSV